MYSQYHAHLKLILLILRCVTPAETSPWMANETAKICLGCADCLCDVKCQSSSLFLPKSSVSSSSTIKAPMASTSLTESTPVCTFSKARAPYTDCYHVSLHASLLRHGSDCFDQTSRICRNANVLCMASGQTCKANMLIERKLSRNSYLARDHLCCYCAGQTQAGKAPTQFLNSPKQARGL